MTNEYDDLLASAPSTDSNEYDDLLQMEKEAQRADLQSSLMGAMQANPDQFAKSKALSKVTGLPAEVVDRNQPDIARTVQLNEYDQFLKKTPKLAGQMADRDFAKIALDDLENLGFFENLSNSFARGWRSLKQAVPNLRTVDAALGLQQLDFVDQELAAGKRPEDIDGAVLGVLADQYRFMSPDERTAARANYGAGLQRNLQEQGTKVAVLEAEKRQYASPGVVGRVSEAKTFGGALGEVGANPLDFLTAVGPESFLQSLPGLAGATVAGLARRPDLAVASLGTSSFVSDFSGSFLEQLGRQGVDVSDPAAVQAALQDPSVFNTALTKASQHAKVVATFDALSGGLASKGGFLVQLPLQAGLGAAGETGGQLAAGDEIRPGDVVAEAAGELVGTPAEIAAMTAPKIKEAVKQTAIRIGIVREQAQAALQDGEALAATVGAAAASKVKARDPQSFKDFVEAATADGPVQDVYIDAKTFVETLNQAGVDPQAVAQASPAIAAQLSEAVTTAADIRIPLGEFVTQIAGQDFAQALVPHLRTSPDAMSAAEAQEFMQSEAEVFKQEVEATLQSTAEVDSFERSASAVEGDLLGQLNAANRFTPDVNQAYASLMRDFYVTQAHQLGVTPQELYQRYPLRVQAESVAGDTQLDQAAQEGPVAHLWTGLAEREGAFQTPTTTQTDLAGAVNEVAQGLNAEVSRPSAVKADSDGLKPDLDITIETPRGGRVTAAHIFESESSHPFIEIGNPSLDLGTNTGRLYQAVAGWALNNSKTLRPDPRGLSAINEIRRTEQMISSMLKYGESRMWEPEISQFAGLLDDGSYAAWLEQGRESPSLVAKLEKLKNEYWGPDLANATPPELTAARINNMAIASMMLAARKSPESFNNALVDSKGNVRTKDQAGSVATLDSESGRQAAAASGAHYQGVGHSTRQRALLTAQATGWTPSHGVAGLREFGAQSLQVIDAAGHPSRHARAGVRYPGLVGLVDSANTENLLYQSKASNARGQISFGSDITQQASIISLLKNADLSTFLHESGHFFLEVYSHMAAQPGAPQSVVDDFNTLLTWFGVPDIATWRGMSPDQKRDSHEQFARGFEAYLFEGKAPNPEVAGLFQKFRAWLLNVYRSLASLNVTLTDEVRGVMDRMLASEDQIRAAEAARGFTALLDKQPEDMTVEEWQQYKALDAEATQTAVDQLQKRSLRDMRWLSNAKSRMLKELQSDAEDKRKVVRAEVVAEVNREPIYAAMRFVRTGELEVRDQTNKQRRAGEVASLQGTKLSLPALKEMYGEGPAAPWRYFNAGKNGLVSAKDGVHPDIIATLFGFSSGDELVRKMLAADPVRQVVDAITDQRMLERYGDLTDPAVLERAAEEAIHNEARAKFVATELRALNKAVGNRNVLAKAAREFAALMVARKRVRDVKPAQFAAAETRAARAAEQLLAKGKTPEAANEKRNQLINVYGTKAAHDALQDVDRGVTYLKKFEREGVRAGLDPEYIDQIDKLLERFDLRRGQSNRQIDKRKSLAEWVEGQQSLGFDPIIDDAVLNEAKRQHYRDMTVEEFRGLVDTVKNIEHLGRLKKKLLTAKDQREFAAIVEDAAKTINDNAKRTIAPKLEQNTFTDRVKSGTAEFFAMHRKFASIVREMDGFKEGGLLWGLFIRPMNAAGDAEATAREKSTISLTKLFKPILKTGKLQQKTYIPSIGTSLSREGRLAVALNWGNEANRMRILEGDAWSPAQVQAILDTLTKEEWDFVQGVWDYVDTYWAQIAEKEKRVSGVAPEKVQPVAVQTKFGEYKGGYYPIKYDPTRSTKSESDTLAESIKQAMQGLYTRATTRRGHTKARVDSVKRPVRKDLGVVFEHVEQVVHDLAWHEYLIDANRLLRAGAIDSAVRDHYGPEVLRVMRKALDDIAAGDVPAQNAFERSINHLRSGASIAGLGWNLATSLLQPIGLTQSMVRIGPKWVAKGLSRFLRNAATMESTGEFIYDKSEFMRLRGKTMQREISEIRNRVTGKRLTAVQESYFWLIQKGQLLADFPTWLGAYEKSMEQTKGDEAKAIALADQAVLDAQGGGQIKDLAQIQRGGPLMKLWTNFYSFFNTTYNLTAESLKRTDFRKPGDVGRLAVDFLLLYSIPAVFAQLMKDALKGGDDDDELAKKLLQAQASYLMGTMVGLRELGSAINGFSGYSGPAGTRFFSELSKLYKQAEQGEVDEAALKALNNVAGILFHYPAGQVQRTVEGVIAYTEDETDNPGVLVAGP